MSSQRHLLQHHYGGWSPSRPDQRNFIADTSRIKVLAEVDPRKDLPPVFDQGHLGSCTANATCAAFQYDSILDGLNSGPLSRLWTYWQERRIEGSLGQGDTGAYGHDAFKAAQKVGICLESDWPYQIGNFDPATPPAAASKDARHYVLTKPYARVSQSELAIKQALSNRQTVAIGFTVYESFESPEVAQTGIVPMPGQDEQVLGGHEVLVIGYLKSEPHYFLVRNSWGIGWGISGCFLMPVAYVCDRNLTSDVITIQRPLGK